MLWYPCSYLKWDVLLYSVVLRSVKGALGVLEAVWRSQARRQWLLALEANGFFSLYVRPALVLQRDAVAGHA